MSSESKRIDFSKTDTTDVEFTGDATTLVENLDFEQAERLAASKHQQETNLVRDSSARFNADCQRYQAEIREEVGRQKQRIRREVQFQIEDIKSACQTEFTEMVQRHRAEADDLKADWVRHHQRAEKIARHKIADMIHTSQVLASVDRFESARRLRDHARNNEDMYIGDEVHTVDASLREQFRAMIHRHEHQYETLADDMKKRIELAEGEGKIAEAKLRADAQYEEAHSPVKMMEDISRADFSPIEKKSIIASLSPGRLNTIRTSPVKLSPSLFE
jgi:hypothetical protein